MNSIPPQRGALYIVDPSLITAEARAAFDVELPALAATHGATRCERLEIGSGAGDLERPLLIALALSHAQLVVTPTLAHLGGCAPTVQIVADIYTGDHLIVPTSGSWNAAFVSAPADPGSYRHSPPSSPGHPEPLSSARARQRQNTRLLQ
ncbi:hypothetical protein [Nocardia sp. NBC_01388]|uniref:hypothetical protein n=1 Tax=Nocardia sp. NBC_01388 TaxID=2903596 RepID=UPI003248F01F